MTLDLIQIQSKREYVMIKHAKWTNPNIS